MRRPLGRKEQSHEVNHGTFVCLGRGKAGHNPVNPLVPGVVLNRPAPQLKTRTTTEDQRSNWLRLAIECFHPPAPLPPPYSNSDCHYMKNEIFTYVDL